MKAEIITIGDELLNGQVVDTNSAWIAQQLAPLNIRVIQITSISDKKEAIEEALEAARQRAQIVLVTGGLGPTNDDVTKATIATYFDSPIIRDEEVLRHVERLFAKFGFTDMPPINQKQADVLAHADVLFNDVGTAPGMWIEREGCVFVFMPGVPFEMKYLMRERVLPRFAAFAAREITHNAYILTVGIGESHLARQIADIEDDLPDYIRLAYLPKIGLVRLRLTASGTDGALLERETATFVDRITARLEGHIVAHDARDFEEIIVEKFTEAGVTLATAESCTGGAVSASITAIPGASQMFNGAAVTYANSAKRNILAVTEETLTQFGAVSEQTVVEMAHGAKRVFQTDYAIATSGVAGPGGGTEEKPVGMVCVAVVGRYGQEIKTFQFTNDRQINIERTVAMSLNMLWNLFMKEV